MTKMRTVIVEMRDTSSPLGDSYLIICVVVLVALVLILAVVFFTKKCRKHNV